MTLPLAPSLQPWLPLGACPSFKKDYSDHVTRSLLHWLSGDWGSRSCLYGPQKSGKTYYLDIIFDYASQNGMKVLDVSRSFPEENAPSLLLNLWDDIEFYNLWIWDDIETYFDSQEMEEALFHLLNRLHRKKTLLLCSVKEQTFDSIRLKDLKTRLKDSLAVSCLPKNDDALKEQIKYFVANRAWQLTDENISYLFRHYSRDLSKLLSFFSWLEKRPMKAPLGNQKMSRWLLQYEEEKST